MKYKMITRGDEASNTIAKLIKDCYLQEDEEVVFNPDHVFAVGGDGTFLRAVHDLFTNSTPSLENDCIIHGINTGTLGFYTSYTPVKEQMDELFNNIRNNNCRIKKVKPLSFWIKYGNQETDGGIALNDITITTKERKTLTTKVFIQEGNSYNYFEKFKGTGLCFSTALGSTAYNKALGGAVVHPDFKIIQMTEMAGINSIAYQTLASPMILPEDAGIEIETNDNIVITFDHESKTYTDNISIITISTLDAVFNIDVTNNDNFAEKLKRSFIISK